MRFRIHTLLSILVIALASVTAAVAQQTYTTVPEGQKAEIIGFITSRDVDSFKMITPDGTNIYQVMLTPTTSVKTYQRTDKVFGATYLLRGLRVQVKGPGNASGAIVAKSVKFDKTDLRAAQTLETRVHPLEDQTAANTAHIATNAEKIAQNAERIAAAEENQRRMSGQIEETNAKVDRAQATADTANNRINGLDEFDTVKTVYVPFNTGSSVIGPKAKAALDEAASWISTQDMKGWMFEIVGFADSTGNSMANVTLSERRANSVIRYLVTNHSVPLTRLVQPFGLGANDPLATNDTAAGRAQNRRVEIRMLKNKGIAPTVQ